MIPEIGHIALILALTMALAQSILPLAGAHRGNAAWMSLARPSAQGQFFFTLLSYACLTYAFITDDFSVQLVAENSNTTLPTIYRCTAVWGNHEGSILLWALILLLPLLLIVRGRRRGRRRRRQQDSDTLYANPAGL